MPHVTSKDGTRIAFETMGSGPPLVVVWGAMGYRATPFAKAMREELAKTFTVYDYDRRGRGESGDKPTYAVAREIEDLAAVIDAAGNPYVWATSSGAALALEAAASGVPMRALAAHEPPYMLPDAKRPPAADYRGRLHALVAAGERDAAVKHFMRTVGVPGFFVAIMPMFPFWKSLRASAHTLPYDAAILGDFSLPEKRLREIRTPTILMAGTKTTPDLRASAKAAAALIPGARHVELAGQHHGVKPAALRPALVEALLGG